MKTLHIAFVSSHPSMRRFRKDASFLYRCENLSIALSELGHKVSLLHITALLFRRNFDVIVFLRPSGSRLFDFVVRRLRAKGVILIGDVDDLIFNAELAKYRPSVRNKIANQDATRHKFISHAIALQKLDKLQFSTKELARQYLEIAPGTKYLITPNTAFRTWYKFLPLNDCLGPRISYFSGTRTHDGDLALVMPALLRLIESHQNLIVQIVGPVSINFQHARLKKIKKVKFEEYVGLVQASHICIAPLEDTPFNQCKSALKAFEAAVMNVPIVASPVGEYAELRIDGVLHANSLEEWETQLEFLLNPENYNKLSAGLRERMFDFSSTDQIAQKFLGFAME
jgi:glycosyltransferase involved in cell wall biosynthesis